ncbi:hypothetical protein SAMN04488238_10273 [Roseicitreum antarcticum]|uniref:Uncharacterized protein n=1 Tax=Roseicitreum antarcticum TaxID=564137 RepID=A0A1H2TIW6_9RHOB|nr:hypothetical protein SAMN04488238_10273 [Roseicitreum antarcticum]
MFWPGVSGTHFLLDLENTLVVVFLSHAPAYRTQPRIDVHNAVYAGLNTVGGSSWKRRKGGSDEQAGIHL